MTAKSKNYNYNNNNFNDTYNKISKINLWIQNDGKDEYEIKIVNYCYSANSTEIEDKWYFSFMIRGKRYHKGVPEATCKKDVEKAEIIFKACLLQGKYSLVEDRKYMPLFKLIDEYLKYSKINKISCENDVIYTNHLKNIIGNKDINEITPQIIERYKRIRKEVVQNSTINRELNSISKMFSIAVENKWIDENPCFKVKKLREENRKIRFLTVEEEIKLFKACIEDKAYLKPIIICALHTGMRKSEIIKLKWSCVNLYDEKPYIDILKTKSGKVRKIPMSSILKEELEKLNQDTEYVFINPETQKTYYDLKKPFKRLCDKAGVTNLTFNHLRHTAGTRMVAAGIDLVVVQDILGHSDIKTTMRYSHPVPERKLEAIRALETYNNKLIEE